MRRLVTAAATTPISATIPRHDVPNRDLEATCISEPESYRIYPRVKQIVVAVYHADPKGGDLR
jgi:hypothetical protein